MLVEDCSKGSASTKQSVDKALGTILFVLGDRDATHVVVGALPSEVFLETILRNLRSTKETKVSNEQVVATQQVSGGGVGQGRTYHHKGSSGTGDVVAKDETTQGGAAAVETSRKRVSA
jgi:hypothetical protein